MYISIQPCRLNSVKKDITTYHNEQFKLDLQADDTDSTWEKVKEVLYNIMKNIDEEAHPTTNDASQQ